ncbi:mitochondrial aconitate hydratase [Neoconidiobolus thromboides FSU 785]|nr:mitochondrial aconitate hydratase [Neoconidiobolus thromboides FSU 785]
MIKLPISRVINYRINRINSCHLQNFSSSTSQYNINYDKLISNLNQLKKINSKPLTLSEKIIYSHIRDINNLNEYPIRGESYLYLKPDRVAMQDASAQMAILQFMLSGKKESSVPCSIHCDHLIEAYEGARKDESVSKQTNKEIFDFLKSAADKFALHYWPPGSGIIHQIVLENYATPGALMLGTDSHTPNGGGLAQISIGVGGADAVDAMSDIPWELKAPKLLGIKLIGQLNPWASPKDIILYINGLLTVKGGTGHIIEYFGEGLDHLPCTGMATICNMGAEVGATTSIFPYNDSMKKYLLATSRQQLADQCDSIKSIYLQPDGEVLQDPSKYYDKIIEIDLSQIEPHINGPFTPDLANPISKFKQIVEKNQWQDQIKVGLIGSCTNSSYHDMTRANSIANQAIEKGVKLPSNTQLFISPGSEQIRATIERDNITNTLQNLGGVVLANACGPCIGQWKRSEEKEENSIISSFNRNFKARNDGNSLTKNFLASPEIVMALTLAGKLSFNPLKDKLKDKDGNEFMLQPPQGEDLPKLGFEQGDLNYKPPSSIQPNSSIQINIDKASTRLQELEPFSKWNGEEYNNLKVLLKASGKCTTDHISAAGKWLKYKGHLENIANNTLIGALSADTGKVNSVINYFTKKENTIPEVAKDYKQRNVSWVVITDDNYGEGSAREHAAMQPRYLGCKLIISKSIARIHETNLKKQGILPLTFMNVQDYESIHEGDEITTLDLRQLSPGKSLWIEVIRSDREKFKVELKHTMSNQQIEWFKAGSALNFIANQQK